jgi:hypothetical protein
MWLEWAEHLHGQPDQLKGEYESDTLKQFLARQKVQTDGGNIIEIDTSWLGLGHLDEIVAFASVGGKPKILVAAPQKAMEIWKADDHYGGYVNMTIRKLLTSKKLLLTGISDADLDTKLEDYNNNLWTQKIKPSICDSKLATEVGLTENDYILVPVVFVPSPAPEHEGRPCAWVFPNRINLFVGASTSAVKFVAGDMPEGKDPQLKVRDPLRAEIEKLLGENTVSFIDSSLLTRDGGDVHCGSNAFRSGPSTLEWKK